MRRQETANTPREHSDTEPQLLHEFFVRAASIWPERIAIDVPTGTGRTCRRSVTYEELNRRSTGLAYLLRHFVSAECVVAVFLPRTSEKLYEAEIAILKAGAAHACIETSFPDGQ